MKFTEMEDKKYWNLFLEDALTSAIRDRHIQTRGFCIITKETCTELANILKDDTVLDAGAGTGYLVYHLRKKNINIEGVVSDNIDYPFKDNIITNQLIVDDYTTMDLSKYNTFILSWPDLDGEYTEVFLNRLKSGDKLIYQGENCGGCCATDNFFAILEKDFTEVEKESEVLNRNHVRFVGMHDYWAVYIKN